MSLTFLRQKRCATRQWAGTCAHWTLDNVPDYIMTQKICNEVVRENPAFFLVPDCFKTQRMCIMALEAFPWQLNDIPDYFNTQRVCDDVV